MSTYSHPVPKAADGPAQRADLCRRNELLITTDVTMVVMDSNAVPGPAVLPAHATFRVLRGARP